MKDLVLSAILIILAVLFRTTLHLGPNFELVTAACLAAGYFIKNSKLKIMVPLGIMLISDSIIGNGLIFLFTWSAYLVVPLIGKYLASMKKSNKFKAALMLEGAAVLSVVVFFLWTNLGVVLVSNLYPKTPSGLIMSYINGLPFVKPQLFSAMIATPIVFTISAVVTKVLAKVQFNFANKKNSQISHAI